MRNKATIFWLDLKIVAGYQDCCSENFWNSRVLMNGNNILQRVLKSIQYKVKLDKKLYSFYFMIYS